MSREDARRRLERSVDAKAAEGLGVYNSVAHLVPPLRLTSTKRRVLSDGGNRRP